MTLLLLQVDPQLLSSVLVSASPILAALVVAVAGVSSYRRQKGADREHELIQRKQEEYARYLLSFQHASRWKTQAGIWSETAEYWETIQNQPTPTATKTHANPDDLRNKQQIAENRYLEATDKHADAQATYNDAHEMMLLVASDEVIVAANKFHTYYTESEQRDWRKAKELYAEMIVAMRNDGFSDTKLSPEEIARNIPWTLWDEPREHATNRQEITS